MLHWRHRSLTRRRLRRHGHRRIGTPANPDRSIGPTDYSTCEKTTLRRHSMRLRDESDRASCRCISSEKVRPRRLSRLPSRQCCGTEDSHVPSIRLRLRGRVQGVGFRWFVRSHARRLQLAGWVANHPDGSVEVAAGGDQNKLDELKRAVRQGPEGAEVSQVDELPPIDDLDVPFAVR